MSTETFALEIGRLHRDVPLVRPTPNTQLPLIELLGDAELTRTCALELQKILPANSEVIFTCETSSIVLAHALSELTGLPYEVARKRRRSAGLGQQSKNRFKPATRTAIRKHC